MSDRRPGGGYDRDGRGRPDEPDGSDWLEHEGSSVFSRPAPPGRSRGASANTGWPPPQPRPPGPPPQPPTRVDADPWGGRRPERTAAYGTVDPRWGPPTAPDQADPWGDRWPPPPTAPHDPYGRQGPGRRPTPTDRPPRSDARGGRDDRDRGGGGFRSPIGLGAVVGVGGALAFLAALLVLPWFSVRNEDVTLADIRSAYDLPATDPDDLPGAGGETPSTLPDGLPAPDDIADAAEEQVRDTATEVVAGVIDDGKSRYLELYANTLWLPVAAVVAIAAVVSTLLAPRSAALGMLLGVRRLAGALVVPAAAAHTAALWVVFTGDGAPTPAVGVWIGVGGLAAVFVGCIIGPRD